MTEEIKNDILTAESPETPEITPAPKKKSKKKLWIGLGVGVAGVGTVSILSVIAIIVALVLIFAFNTPKSVAKDYIKGLTEADISYIFDTIHDDVLEQAFTTEQDKNKIIADWNEEMEHIYEVYDQRYKDWEIDYKILHTCEVNAGDLEELQDYYAEEYDCKVGAAKEIEIRATLTSENRDSQHDFTIMVVRIGTKWYLHIDDAAVPHYVLWSLMYAEEG